MKYRCLLNARSFAKFFPEHFDASIVKEHQKEHNDTLARIDDVKDKCGIEQTFVLEDFVGC